MAGAGRAREVGAQVGYDAGRVERAALYQDDDGRTQLAKKALEAAGRIYAPDNRTCAKKKSAQRGRKAGFLFTGTVNVDQQRHDKVDGEAFRELSFLAVVHDVWQVGT